MFDGIAECEVAECDLFCCCFCCCCCCCCFLFSFFFYEIAYLFICFSLIYFYLTFFIWMLKVVLTSFFFFIIIIFISITRTGYHFATSSARLLYLYFIWSQNVLHHYGRVVIPFDFGTNGRAFESHYQRFYFSVPVVFFFFFLVTIFMICFFHPNVS